MQNSCRMYFTRCGKGVSSNLLSYLGSRLLFKISWINCLNLAQMNSCRFCRTSFFSLQREHGANDGSYITMQQHIIIPSPFRVHIYHSKLEWKTIRTASRIRWLNMAKWLSISCIDLDIGELYGVLYLPSKCAIDFQHYCQRRFSPRKMIRCIFSHLC